MAPPPSILGAVLAVTLGPSAAAQIVDLRFDIFALDALAEVKGGSAVEIDDVGVAVGDGFVTGSAFAQPVVWVPGQPPLVLPIPVGLEGGLIDALGEDGIAVGEVQDIKVSGGGVLVITSKAAVWIDGVPVLVADLATSGTADLTPLDARGVDALGRIHGRADAFNGVRPYRLDPDGFLADLGSLVGLESGTAYLEDVGRDGTAVGWAVVADGIHAFAVEDGVMTDLHVSSLGGDTSRAYATNASGVIVGSAAFDRGGRPPFEIERAALWSDGTIHDLGTLGGSWSVALDINEHGTIVGRSEDVSGQSRGFVWEAGVMRALEELVVADSGWTQLFPNAIGNQGAIVGQGVRDGGLRPFVARPRCQGGIVLACEGCVGSNGLDPRLRAQGCAEAGGNVRITIIDAAPMALGLLAVGAPSLSEVCAGGTLAPLERVLPLGLDAEGHVSFPMKLPPTLAPTAIRLQALLRDADMPNGVVATNALTLRVGGTP